MFGDIADAFSVAALIPWIVVFERNWGVKGKPLRGGEAAALDASVAFKKEDIQAIKASLRSPLVWLGKVYSSDFPGPKEDPIAAVRVARTNGHALAAEGLWHLPESSFEADVIFCGGYGTDDLMLVVLHRGQAVRHRSAARPVAAGGDLLIERLMRGRSKL